MRVASLVDANDEEMLTLCGAGILISVGRSPGLEERCELGRSTSITGGVGGVELSLAWIDGLGWIGGLSITGEGSKSPTVRERSA
jgi:hypothetical protein